MLMGLENGDKNSMDFKEKVAFEWAFFMNKLKETVIDAIGIRWVFEDGLSKLWGAIAVMILWYVRWMIKLAIFIYGALFITWLFCSHSGAKF